MNKTMHFLLASRNRHKIRELEDILAADFPDVTVHSLDEVGLCGEIDENGKTFEENACIKAKAARGAALNAGHGDWYCLGDDSGLAVDALDGAPGVYSARFAGEHGNDAANNELLLKKLSGVPADRRGARFLCCIAYISPDGETLTVCGDCPGVILEAPRGQGGFGYDPLFYIPDAGMTFSELSGAEKNAVSHRGRALAALAEALKERRQDKSIF
jgi:XTP/dITP diphosphohydrolase